MKQRPSFAPGIALVIVLGFLVIISALAVAFFSSVTTELKASRNYAAGITTRQLADSAVNVVMGQISAATTRGIDATGKGTEAWASQPGMIRVFSGNSGGTQADAFYKLYSSNKMIITGADLISFNPTVYDSNSDCYSGWDGAPAIWTDLNSPILVPDPSSPGHTMPRFPIVDPRAYTSASATTGTWQGNVEGFTYDATLIHGAVGPQGGSSTQRVPMPVRWVYVLQDGSLITPDSGGTVNVTFSGTIVPTQTNPIVGRIAFWADDETCKLNVNTAAGFSDNITNVMNSASYQTNQSLYAGSFWDTPRFYTQFDYGLPNATGQPQSGAASGGLALCQLLQYEFQRYPGHPATTSLAPVLKTVLNSDQLYTISPRYSNLNLSGQMASTIGGTNRVIVDPINTPGDLDNKEIQPKQDRLYASPDELLFGAHSKTGGWGSPSYQRSTQNTYGGFSGNLINPQVIDSLRFFLTSQSRSPELNLWGQPRVTAWPVRYETNSETTGLNVYDNLIVFCSTIGNPVTTNGRPDTTSTQFSPTNGIYRYVFTRREVATSNTSLVTHGSDPNGVQTKQFEFNSGYIPDWNRPRNQTLLQNYLYPFTQTNIPGVGKALSSKYSISDRMSIMTEIFDYIRLANSQDTTTSIVPPGKAIEFAVRGMVQPSSPTYFNSGGVQAKGFGRTSTLCEATLDFYYAGPVMTNATIAKLGYNSGANPNSGWSHWDTTNSSSRYALTDSVKLGNVTTETVHAGFMRAFMLFSLFDPMQGYAPKSELASTDPKLSIECIWSQDWHVSVASQDYPLGFPVAVGGRGVSTTVYRAPGGYWGGRNYGGYEGFMHTLLGTGSAPGGGPTTPVAGTNRYPQKIAWSATGGTVTPLNSATDYGDSFTSRGSGRVPFTAVPTTSQEYYPFQTDIGKAITVLSTTPTFDFKGGNLIVKLYYGGSNTNSAAPALQTFNLTFPPATGWPVPRGAPPITTSLNAVDKSSNAPNCPTADVTTWVGSVGLNLGTNASNGNISSLGMRHFYWTGAGAFFADMASRTAASTAFSYQTSLQASWALATRIAYCNSNVAFTSIDGGSWNPYEDSNKNPIAPGWMADRWRCIVQPGDTIRSLLYWDATNAINRAAFSANTPGPTAGGDLRLAALNSNVLPASFREHPDYYTAYSRACALRGGDGIPYFPGVNAANYGYTPSYAPVLAGGADPTKEATLGNHIPILSNFKLQPTRAFGNLPWGGGANFSAAVNGVVRADGAGQNLGDWDTGQGDFPDGPFCNKQDEGNVIYRYLDTNINQYIYPIPYFTATWSYQPPGNTFTSPSRQMPSPAMFGSLPSQPTVNGTGNGWQTLAFSPNTAGPNHPGNVDPKDHYILDLFTTPVVEPYPISEPFSTAGKVNLNYRIVPFDYIRRSTALRGALAPLRVTAVNSQGTQPTNNANFMTYKVGQLDSNGKPIIDSITGNNKPLTQNFRLVLDRDQTIAGFDGFYDTALKGNNPNDGFFHSASQVCERWLYPQGVSYAGSPTSEATSMRTWWQTNGDLTGDNEREKPYVDLYPRITTKSNTYTVHVKVQTLRQLPKGAGGNWAVWSEGKDVVLGEYRGSTTVERYVDPADTRFSPTSSNAINPDTQSCEPMYHFRAVITKKFGP